MPVTAGVIGEECRWLAANAINNRMPPPENLFSPAKIEELRRTTAAQRNLAGRVTTALLIYAYSQEAGNPEFARSLRGWGSIADFSGAKLERKSRYISGSGAYTCI